MNWPDAEIEIDAPLVRSLLESQFPRLATGVITSVGSGFDNSMWRVGHEHVARLPRRQAALTLLENEIRWVAHVTRNVAIATPAPFLAGAPEPHYPWPWALATWIDGIPGDQIDLDANEHTAAALARFLRELHEPALADAPFNPARSVTLAERASTFYDRLNLLTAFVDRDDAQHAFELGCDAAPWAVKSWIHGDFHPANTLYVDDELAGVVDFGDLCAGDPATDLAGGLMALPFGALDHYFSSYGGVDDDTVRRTLGWAMSLGAFMVSLGREGRPTYLDVGSRALINAVRLSREL